MIEVVSVCSVRGIARNWVLTISVFLLLGTTCIADTSEVDLGDSLNKLIEIEGEATKITVLVINDTKFLTYYYQASNTSYVIDAERGFICEVEIGEAEGYCYPCDYGSSAGTCP